MLALPLLRAEGSAGLTNFSLFLKAQKYTDDALVEKEVKEFESLRASAVTITEASDLSQQQLLQYFQTLKSIAPRVANFESEMKLSFTWIDPFMNFRKHTSGSFYYEMAAVAYNLAALESTRGGRVDRATEEGIKAASKHFQQAAGFYDYILETLLPKMTLTTVPCLSVDALTMARDLMLAQAQLCFYEKSIRDRKAGKMKAGIIAKLAYQTSIFYSKASHLCKSRLSIDKSWHTLTDFQCKCFQGAAEYWQATASKEIASQVGTGYGEEVARLRRAENFITQALQVSKTNPLIPSLPAGAQALLDVIISNKKTAEYDINTGKYGN